MSKKCLMLLAPDLRDAPFVVLVPPGRALAAELPPELEGAVVVEVDHDGWHVKLGEAPDSHEQTIMDRTDWGAPEIRVVPNGETRPTLRCRLPMNEDEELVVGRSSRRAHLAIEDEHVSRRHLRFFQQDGKQMVQDLDSRGGTFVNGDRIQVPTELHHQDSIRIGNTTLEYFAFLEALDGLPDFEELARPVEGGTQKASDRPSGGRDPDPDEEVSAARPEGIHPAASAGRPLWDTVMYSMAILTILVALVVAWKFLL